MSNQFELGSSRLEDRASSINRVRRRIYVAQQQKTRASELSNKVTRPINIDHVLHVAAEAAAYVENSYRLRKTKSQSIFVRWARGVLVAPLIAIQRLIFRKQRRINQRMSKAQTETVTSI